MFWSADKQILGLWCVFGTGLNGKEGMVIEDAKSHTHNSHRHHARTSIHQLIFSVQIRNLERANIPPTIRLTEQVCASG